jgi:hypothetical protein
MRGRTVRRSLVRGFPTNHELDEGAVSGLG